MVKVIKWVIALGILGAMGWIGLKWYRAQQMSISIEAFHLIPSDAIFCIASDHPIESWKEIAGSGAWGHLQKNAYFAALTASANSLDSLIHQNDLLFGLIGARALMVSAHMTGPKKYDFLFLADLKEASGIKFLNEYLTTFSTTGFTIQKEKYASDDLIILHNPADSSNLYISLPGTYLVASYSKRIVTSALDSQQGDNSLARETFETADPLGSNQIVRLYLNYTMLPRFMMSYSDGANEYVNHLSRALRSSSLSVTLDNELIKASGPTYVNDSVESYLKTLSISGKGATEITEIAPARTAFYLGFGFSSLREFFVNFEKNLQQDVAEYKVYRQNLKQIEDYLKINLQENFINWIGDEVALVELQSGGKGLDNETALVLKADNIEKARKDLGYIEKMIRKKTPVKFKTIDHRGYAINYLSMKGLFKILFGKFFARYDKPYYTIINNFVIFSNHPQTLESIIDDHLSKNTLIKSEEFRDFRKEFDDEGSVFVYINTPVLFNTMKKLADAATRTSMESNKPYIVCFRQIGFQLVPESGRFKTILAEHFEEPEHPTVIGSVAQPNEEIDSLEADDSRVIAEESDPAITEKSDPMALPYIYVLNLNASSYTSYFPDSTVNFIVELKNGFKEGSFTEYYPNSEVKMTGHFKNDKRQGTWHLYDEKGKLVMKRNYKGDVIKKEKMKD
jgi:hypothetical protein